MAILKALNSKGGSGTRAALSGLIHYMLNEDKLAHQYTTVLGVYGGDNTDEKTVYQEFIRLKAEWGKTAGRQYEHKVISFHPDEKITPEQVLDFAIEFCIRAYHYNQVLIAVHEDHEYLHAHMCINNVSYIDGHKTQASAHDYARMKEIVNDICRERGLSIAEKGFHFNGEKIEPGIVRSYDKDKYQALKRLGDNSFLVKCIKAIVKVIAEGITNLGQFKDKLLKQGWDVTWPTPQNPHTVYTDNEGHKVRAENLSNTFNCDVSMEGIKHECIRQRQQSRTEEYLDRYLDGIREQITRKTNDDRSSYRAEISVGIELERHYDNAITTEDRKPGERSERMEGDSESARESLSRALNTQHIADILREQEREKRKRKTKEYNTGFERGFGE